MKDIIHFLNGKPVTEEQLAIKIKSTQWSALVTAARDTGIVPSFYGSSVTLGNPATSQYRRMEE